MSIVVSDTSPIRALHQLGLIDLLETLYHRVYLPEAVAVELKRTGTRYDSFDITAHSFFIVESPHDASHVRQLEARLDAGEAAAIVLALERSADYVLLDERDGRRAARKLGLTVVGV